MVFALMRNNFPGQTLLGIFSSYTKATNAMVQLAKNNKQHDDDEYDTQRNLDHYINNYSILNFNVDTIYETPVEN